LEEGEVRVDPWTHDNQVSLEKGIWLMAPELKDHPFSLEVFEVRLDLCSRTMIAAGHERPLTDQEPAGGGATTG
jgi:hypothetical protein